jgi:hypothetical protein
MPSRWAAVAVALVGAAVVLAGCGKSAEEEFRDDLKPVRVKLETQKSQIAGLLQSVKLGRPRDARALADAAGALGVTVNGMAKMSAPDSVEDEFKGFRDANVQLVTSLGAFAQALAGRSESRLKQRGELSQAAASKVRQAENALDDALAG